MMNKEDINTIEKALALLHDFISNYGAKEEHYNILNSSYDVMTKQEERI